MDAHKQVRFRTLFPDSWKKLQRRGATIDQIQPDRKGAHVTIGWFRNRLVSTLFRRLRRNKPKSEEAVSWQLYNLYVQQFAQGEGSRASELSSPKLRQRQVSWNPGHKTINEPDTGLHSRQNYHIATAMQLAGLANIKEQNDDGRLEPTGHPVDSHAIAVMDRCVNSSPVRLAYEYIAAGQYRKLPSRFLTLLLIPSLSEQLAAGTGITEQEAQAIVEGLLRQHGIEHPADLSLECLMEIKNSIRRMGHEHRRVVSAIAGQRFIGHNPRPEVPRSPITTRPRIRAINPERLLADEGATIDSAREHFIEQLREAGLSAQEASDEIERLFRSQNMRGEADFTLTRFIALADEVSGMVAKARKIHGKKPAGVHSHSRSFESEMSVVEYFSRLKFRNTSKSFHLPSRQLPESGRITNRPSSRWAMTQSPDGHWIAQGHPDLEPPDSDPDILCDADDEWLIKQQVENGHLLRMAKDFGMRLVRWCGRNKRVIGVNAGLLGLMGVFYAVQTGGLSVAIMLVTFVLTSASWLGINALADRIQRYRIALKLKRADQARAARGADAQPGAELDDYLDGYGWLTREHGLTNILNSFKNLQNEVRRLEKSPPPDDTEAVIKYRRAQCLAQLRSRQLGKSFENLDRLLVESVQEISRLDNHFRNNFDQLWQPLEQLDQRELMRVFNDAANSPGIKKHWFLPKQDYSKWVRQTLAEKATEADRIALLLEQKLRLDKELSLQELQLKDLHTSVDKHFDRAADIAKAGFHVGKSYVRATLRSTLWRYIESGLTKAVTGANPSLTGLTPIPTAGGALFWAYCFAATKVTETLNKLLNKAGVKQYRTAHDGDRFDTGFSANPDKDRAQQARKDFNDRLLAIRREAKESTQTFINTIKSLRKEKELIDEELQKQLEQNKELTHKQYVARARLILRHKILEKKVYELMNGALGNMHNETVKAASWLQESAGIYVK